MTVYTSVIVDIAHLKQQKRQKYSTMTSICNSLLFWFLATLTKCWQ